MKIIIMVVGVLAAGWPTFWTLKADVTVVDLKARPFAAKGWIQGRTVLGTHR